MFTIMLFLSMSFAAYGAPSSTGCNISTEGLSPEVVKQMMDLCVKDKEQQASVVGVASNNIKNLGEFAAVSKAFASSLGIAANELGVAVNTFLASPAGMLTAGVIIWKVFAMNILGMFFILVTIGIWIFMLRAVMTEKIETKMVEGWGKTQKEKRTRIYMDFENISCERGWALVLVNIVPIILIAIIVGNMMR
jgi:hypothetical protein